MNEKITISQLLIVKEMKRNTVQEGWVSWLALMVQRLTTNCAQWKMQYIRLLYIVHQTFATAKDKRHTVKHCVHIQCRAPCVSQLEPQMSYIYVSCGPNIMGTVLPHRHPWNWTKSWKPGGPGHKTEIRVRNGQGIMSCSCITLIQLSCMQCSL